MKILLAVTGSISCYKAIDICRDLSKQGHEVKIILTNAALNFLKPDIFRYLGAIEVFTSTDDFNLEVNHSKVLHIELAQWCDRFIVCPLSANTLSKLACGLSNDLLSSVFLSLDQTPTLLFPAMNPKMLNHAMTKHNAHILKQMQNVFIHPPKSGTMVCGDTGEGKLPDTDRIIDVINSKSFNTINKQVLITTGATKGLIDPVRYVTNPSSGKTGYELAKVFLSLGYKVHVIAGEGSISALENLSEIPGYKISYAQTTEEMANLVATEFPSTDIYISAAAICDLEFQRSDIKLKKAQFDNSLHYSKATDILQNVLSNQKKHQYIIGFAAETSTNKDVFIEKWNQKPVDLLIGNPVSNARNKMEGFQQDFGDYFFIQDGELLESANLSKKMLGHKIHRYCEVGHVKNS